MLGVFLSVDTENKRSNSFLSRFWSIAEGYNKTRTANEKETVYSFKYTVTDRYIIMGMIGHSDVSVYDRSGVLLVF